MRSNRKYLYAELNPRRHNAWIPSAIIDFAHKNKHMQAVAHASCNNINIVQWNALVNTRRNFKLYLLYWQLQLYVSLIDIPNEIKSKYGSGAIVYFRLASSHIYGICVCRLLGRVQFRKFHESGTKPRMCTPFEWKWRQQKKFVNCWFLAHATLWHTVTLYCRPLMPQSPWLTILPLIAPPPLYFTTLLLLFFYYFKSVSSIHRTFAKQDLDDQYPSTKHPTSLTLLVLLVPSSSLSPHPHNNNSIQIFYILLQRIIFNLSALPNPINAMKFIA